MPLLLHPTMYRHAKASVPRRAGEEASDRRTVAMIALRRVCAVAALALAALPAAIAAAVLLIALGPPLSFRQVRCGLDGRHIVIRKFRTMHDLRDPHGRLLPDADRVSPITRLIRRLRLDEIPQLLAVFDGDLAFVGPRPLTPEIITKFGRAGIVRCSVRPGLTGWAQVNGNTLLSDQDKLALDIWYVDHRSAWLDLRILALTVAMLIFGERIGRDSLDLARAHFTRRFPERGPPR
jgi:lipopolysaccharide/colanic/teichoic acid biosynthesis glycosyltransferase